MKILRSQLKHTRRGITLVEVTVSDTAGRTASSGFAALGRSSCTVVAGRRKRHGRKLSPSSCCVEILIQSYEDPNETPDWKYESSESQSLTSRADFDDTDDYDDWTASSATPGRHRSAATQDGTLPVLVKKLNASNYTASIYNSVIRDSAAST
ncbi:MAG: hypothetical protein R3C02_23925 [Planctomycetaceae bacterium]